LEKGENNKKKIFLSIFGEKVMEILQVVTGHITDVLIISGAAIKMMAYVLPFIFIIRV
jgi:hypothetical protein